MKTYQYKTEELRALHGLARYETHGGYTWAAVMDDGELVCTRCVLGNFREIYRATRDGTRIGWRVIGLANSGDAEVTEYCAHCGKTLWEHGNV